MSGHSNPKTIPLIAAIALLTLAGCNTTGDNGVLGSAKKDASHNNPENPTQHTSLANTRTAMTDYCPKTTLREGTDSFRLYTRKAKKEKKPEGLRYQATILKISRDCTYAQGQLLIRIGVAGRVINGPAGETGTFKMPLRVAVKAAGELVYSKLHQLDGTITTGSTNGNFSFIDDQVSIPAPTSPNVRIFVGFDEGPYNTP